MVLSVAMAAQGGLPALAQAVPFPVQEFQARDRIARALIVTMHAPGAARMSC